MKLVEQPAANVSTKVETTSKLGCSVKRRCFAVFPTFRACHQHHLRHACLFCHQPSHHPLQLHDDEVAEDPDEGMCWKMMMMMMMMMLELPCVRSSSSLCCGCPPIPKNPTTPPIHWDRIPFKKALQKDRNPCKKPL